jgi:hypothetical protein
MLADPVEPEIEAPEAATCTVVTSTEAVVSASGEPMPDAVVVEQPTPSQGGDVEGLMPPVVLGIAEGVLVEPATGAESVAVVSPAPTTGADADAPPPPITGADERAAEVAEPSSLQPTAAVDEVAQEPDAPEGATRATSVVWTSLGPLPRWVPEPTTRWAPGTTRLVPHGT